jgi:hypothetical protein
MSVITELLTESWSVLAQMAPYLLFGFLVAGILSVWVSPALVERHLGGSGLLPVVKASLFGVPLPLCSCGVIPVSASIRRHGASRAATAAFLISTPQTGVDSIAVTYAMLGGVYAVFRPLAALATGLIGGLLVQVFDQPRRAASAHPEGLEDLGGETPPADEQLAEPLAAGAAARPGSPRWQTMLTDALRYGLVTLPRDIGRPLLFGVLVAGAIAALLRPEALKPYLGGGPAAILLMMLAAVPVYVCATASVPIAAGLVHAGASPGAALAFLIAGPATNAATISVIWKLLGRRTALIYLVLLALSALGAGLGLDAIYARTTATLPPLGGHVHEAAGAGWVAHAWTAGLLVMLGWSFWSGRGAKASKAGGAEPTGPRDATPPRQVELSIGGITCSHCVDAVRRALAASPGVETADVDLQQGRAVVSGRRFDPPRLVDAVEGLGYSAKLIQ